MTQPKDYQELKALNYSGAKMLLRSPAHYQTWLAQPKEDTPALKTGRLVHLAALQPRVYDEVVRIIPDCDRRTKEGKEVYAAFEASLRPGDESVKRDDAEVILRIAEAAQVAIEHIGQGMDLRIVEQTYVGKHAGVDIKGRPDMVLGKEGVAEVVVDVKTCQDAGKAFARDVVNFRYHLQAAWYLTLTGCSRFVIVAVEKEPPHAWAMYELDAESLAEGRRLMEAACLLYAECLTFKAWPAYPKDVQTLTLPKWGFGQD